MFKGTFAGTATAGNALQFVKDINSNNNISYGNGVISFLKPGYYEVNCMLNLTGVAEGNITAKLMNGSTAVTESAVSGTSTATTDMITLNVYDIIHVEKQNDSEYAEMSVNLSAGATVSNSVMSVKKIS